MINGRLQKKISDVVLACRTCEHFRDDNLDYFYCILQKKEFPALCSDYQYVFKLPTFVGGLDV